MAALVGFGVARGARYPDNITHRSMPYPAESFSPPANSEVPLAELKTQPTTASVTKFIAGVTPERRRHDALAVMKLMKQATGEKPKLWGSNIVGYGTCRIRYASGRDLEWMLIGFSPRKTALVLYITSGFPRYATLRKKLGKQKPGKGCLHVSNLEDVDMETLETLIRESVENMREKHT